MKFLGIIPARGGSKGIPNKNLIHVAGHPMIYHTIQAAKKSELLSEFVVTSDSQNILEYSSSLDVKLLRKRPDNLATDTAATADVVIDALVYVKEIFGEYPENFFILQPTSPIRSGKILDDAILKFEKDKATSLVGASIMTEPPNECIRTNEGSWTFLEKPTEAMRRQEYPDNFYYINGSVYICNTSWFLKKKIFIEEGKTKLFIMNKEYGIDVDERYDLYRAEAAFNYIKNKELF